MSNQLARISGNGAVAQDRAVPWTPFRDLMGFDPFQNLRASYGFDYDVSRNENGYEVEVPVPGYNAEQVDVSLKDSVLTVACKSQRRSFTRSFTIPEDVDVEAIGASVQDGMLRIALPRRPEAKPRKINVERQD
jgi:HSP20 family molecular chaperone IbpA